MTLNKNPFTIKSEKKIIGRQVVYSGKRLVVYKVADYNLAIIMVAEKSMGGLKIHSQPIFSP